MVIHCIKARVLGLTKSKQEDLDFEYNGFQWWMQFGLDLGILSQHKRAKGWKYKKIKYKNYPLIIPKDRIRFRYKHTKLTPHWIKISIAKRKGVGVWLPIKPHKCLPNEKYFKESLLIKKSQGYYELRLIYDIPTLLITPKNILAIDLGERTIATVCDSLGNIRFLGKEVRGIRRHFAWLRRKLGQKRLFRMIKKLGSKEKRKVDYILHIISKEIVQWAKKINAVIIVGNLKGIRKKAKGKKLNRLISSMPFYKLTQMIRYKARQIGIQVFSIKEYNTSKTCHKCKARVNRKTQASISCESCGMQYNADLNASINIGNRAREQGILARAMAQAQESVQIVTGKSIKITV